MRPARPLWLALKAFLYLRFCELLFGYLVLVAVLYFTRSINVPPGFQSEPRILYALQGTMALIGVYYFLFGYFFASLAASVLLGISPFFGRSQLAAVNAFVYVAHSLWIMSTMLSLPYSIWAAWAIIAIFNTISPMLLPRDLFATPSWKPTSLPGTSGVFILVMAIPFVHAQDARANSSDIRTIRAVFAKPAGEIDLARAELTFDRIVDPTIDIDATLRQIGEMAETIKAMAGPSASDIRKVAAIRTYIYKSGPWNGYNPFAYDLVDPEGKNFFHKLLPNYLATRRGNCISMPFLFIVLGNRMGLEVTAALAPRHVFVKFTDRATGKTINLETTSGANPARDVWLRHELPMTDQSVENGTYLRPLTKTETLVIMAEIVPENYLARKQYRKTVEATDVLLRYFPNDITLLLKQATAAAYLIDTDFRRKYPTPDDIPLELRPSYLMLAQKNRSALAKALSLGWRPSRQLKSANSNP